MLNCTVCGHDNFPFTNAQINGWASGASLQMVSQCHKCGSRVAEKCKVCMRLHPLNTTHCSVHGIRIQDFLDLKTDIQTRVDVFKNLLEVEKARAESSRVSYKFSRIFRVSILLFLLTLLGFIWPILGLIFFMSSAIVFVGSVILWFRADSRISSRMFMLWREVNPGALEPIYINVHRNKISIDFESRDAYYPQSLDSRLLYHMQNQVG